MSDHHGPSHDLPEYRPNWPLPTKIKVLKRGDWWCWEHPCRYRGGVPNLSYPYTDWGAAMTGAWRHLERCI